MFSSDVVAFEAQTAPLWESSAKQNGQSPTKKRESNEQNNVSTARKRRRKPVSISRRWNDKRKKIMLEFTECKLCELKFKSEVLMEEHLFSILHHRALHTEKGECQHVCNLCGVTCRNLASFVQHLQDASHKNKSTERKAEIDAGNYKTPGNKLQKYTSTFMCLPMKSKNSRKKVVGKKITPMLSKHKGFFNPNSSGFDNECSLQNSRGSKFKGGLVPTPSDRHDWNNERTNSYGYMHRFNNYYSHYDWTEDTYSGLFQNPYEHGWVGSFDQWPDRDSYHWERSDYGYENRNNFHAKARKEFFQSRDELEGSLRKSQTNTEKYSSPNRSHVRSVTDDQTRTKKLVAQAHKVLRNGNTRNTTPYKGGNLKLKEDQKTKKIPSNLVNKKCKSKKSIFDDSLGEASYDSSLKQSKRKTDTGPRQSNSVNSSHYAEKIVGSVETDLSSACERNSSREIKKWRSMKRSISLESKVLPNIYNEFRKQIDKELGGTSSLVSGPSRVKSYEQENMNRNICEDLQNQIGSPIVDQSDTPISDIGVKFRKILEDIDGPVASASEILRGMEQGESHLKNSEISVETSWTHTTGPLSSTCSNALTASIAISSEEDTKNITHTSNKTGHTLNCDTTQYTPLPTSAKNIVEGASSHSCSLGDVTGKNSAATSTPLRDCETSIGENDTPSNKNRLQPQPNVNKARSRLTSKQKDSPDIPADVRHAKLKKLLLKYDRTNKRSPGAKYNSGNKKPVGPRFGIELNLRNETSHSSGMESIAEKIELIEVLPQRRTRSLSEGDSFLSFGMESVCNMPSFNCPLQQAFQNTIQQKQTTEIRTSTPTCSTQPQCDGLNSKLLSMSEREETLHASIRSLAVQEASTQSEIASKVSALRTLQAELEKLNERKLCIDALKRRNEEELEALRGERLMLLRGTVSNSSNCLPHSSSIFQNVPPNSRHMTPSFDKSIPNQNTVPVQSPEVHGLCETICTSHMGHVTSSNHNNLSTSGPNQNVPDQFVSMSDSWGMTPSSDESRSNPNTLLGSVHVQSQKVADLVGATGTSLSVTSKEEEAAPSKLCNSGQMLETSVVTIPPEIDIMRVKSEPVEVGDVNLPFVSEFQKHDKENNTSEDSTKFYSFAVNEEEILSNDNVGINNILSKYTKKVEMNKKSPRKKPKTSRIATRRSPRNSNKETHDTPSPKKNKDGTTSMLQNPKTLDDSDAVVSNLNENDKLAECVKTHKLPLIGMSVLKCGLITCSLDETIALHQNGDLSGEKVFEKLDATPTAMTAASTFIGNDFVFVSTQKIVSQKINETDSEVINNMEYFVNIFAISDSKRKTTRRSALFNLTSRIMMKTRVLCMHYNRRLLFCGMRDGMAAIISLNASFTPEEDINILECHSCSAITCLTTGTEGPRRILCCGSTDCTVSVRDATDGLLLRTIQGHTKTITCVQIVHNELFSASVDRRVLGHDLITGNLLHKFLGHVGVVRSFFVTGERMVTLCSDRNIRFFDTKSCRLLLKPKLLKSLPLYVDVETITSDNWKKNIVFVGCEDSTVVRIPFPSNHLLSEDGKDTNMSGSVNDCIVNLTGDFECKWTGCTEVGTYTYVQTLRKHIFDVHLNVYDLVGNSTDSIPATLSVGTCCQWESCTHYFALELDTMTDVQTHVQRHLLESHRGKSQEKQQSSEKN